MPDLLTLIKNLSVLRAPEGQPFTLASGKKSMIYVDIRRSALNGAALWQLSTALLGKIRTALKSDARLVAGVALGGCPLATGVTIASTHFQTETEHPLQTLYVRKEAKEHGTGKLVEGLYESGDHVVLVEDVITSGGSSLKAIENLEKEGLIVDGVVAVLDREEGGRDRLTEALCPLVSLFTLKELTS